MVIDYHGRCTMMVLENAAKAAACVAALLMVASSSAAAPENKQTTTQTTQTSKAFAAVRKPHRLVLQVNTNEPALMNLALNNATNVAQYYKDRGQKVAIEVVTFGPGLHMLRDDTSPVKERIRTIKESTPAISFKACGNTQANMSKIENKEIPLISEATLVKSGVVRVMELQERGWAYVKP
jgi:intracellular sulfur oxidation DsrE/DsrF family protein